MPKKNRIVYGVCASCDEVMDKWELSKYKGKLTCPKCLCPDYDTGTVENYGGMRSGGSADAVTRSDWME